MKFTTSAALAAAATGVAAQDNWNAWSSTTAKPVAATSAKSCSPPATTVKTETTTAYQSTSEVFKSTVTVPIPDHPASFSVNQKWGNWDTTATGAAPVTTAPTECVAGKTITSTSTITSTIPGTTTITKSVLFVGAQVTGNADAAWAQWNPSNNAGSGSSPASSNGNGNSWGNGSPSNGQPSNGQPSNGGSSSPSWGNGQNSGPGDIINGVESAVDNGLNGLSEWGQGSWGGKGTGGLQLGSGDDVFHWAPQAPSNTKSGVAPVYTKGPKGWSGPAFGGAGDWNDWLSPGSSKNNGGNGGKNSTSSGNSGNSTSPAGDYGSDSSNVTKPFEPLKDSQCNTAADRSKWCNGLSIDTNYYSDCWNDNHGLGNMPAGGAGRFGGSCSYDLVITNGTWNRDGEDEPLFLINGQFPGPAIECNWGDLVQITVHNQLQSNGTAIHWHGIRQFGTNDQDGVPGVTECAIAPGQSRTYTWRACSYGTSWYHSHWNLQYGDGVQGPVIIHGPATANYDVDAGPVMITDTFGMSATAFGSLTAHQGPLPVDNYLLNGKNTKADLSAGQHAHWSVQKGKKYLFRIINSAAQNMYSVSIDQHKMKVIASDFVPVVPYETEWLNIGIGQRYDVIVEMNQDVDTYFFRAVTQTLCPSASKNSGLGQANGIIAYEGVHQNPLYLPSSTINGNKTASDFNICKDEPLASLVPHLKLSAGSKSAFQSSASTLPAGQVTKVNTADDGAVFRWFLNNGAMYVNYTQPTLQSLNEKQTLNSTVYANQITLKQKNEWVYFVIQNQFVAFHPLHLHGHDFSVLGQGDGVFTSSQVDSLNFDNPPRRDTAMLAGATTPQSTAGYTVIGFQTDNPGAWLMHCHIAWHVDGGLALQWIERPDDMKSYAAASDFKNECDAYAAYEAKSPAFRKTSGQSGLRRREDNYFDRVMSEAKRQFSSVVRRENHAKHQFLESPLRRGLGDGVHGRTFGRRRSLLD